MSDEAGFDPAYLNTLDEIYHPRWMARKRFRIELLRRAVEHFWPGDSHPTKLVHIAGTNGKGSVAHYLSQSLASTGTVGSWTGPHLFDYAERFHIDGRQASHGEIVDIYRSRLRPYQSRLIAETRGEGLSFAEFGILIALFLFDRHGAKYGLMEVGAGGRFTPLMALEMAVCIVTNVGNDHPVTLGSELWQRALDKAGIARPGVPFVTTAEGEALEYVRSSAEAEGATVTVVRERDVETCCPLPSSEPRFQRRNKTLAAIVASLLEPGLDQRALTSTMTAHLPGRFWQPHPNVVADVAHNPEKVAAFASQLLTEFPDRPLVLLVGLTRQREASAVFAPLLPVARRIYVTEASYAGRDPEEIARELELATRGDTGQDSVPIEVVRGSQRAYELARRGLVEDELLVCVGSAYMIDQALNPNPYVRHINATLGWRGPSSTS